MRWLCWWQPPCLLRRVTVNFVHDTTEALDGVLWTSTGPWLTLRDVVALRANQQPVKMVGDIVIHRNQVAFMQVAP